MDNVSLQAIIDEYGDRLCAIQLDNTHTIWIGYRSENSVSLNQIELTTKGNADVFIVHYKRFMGDRVIEYSTLFPTECIQGIVTMDDGYEKWRVDPISLK